MPDTTGASGTACRWTDWTVSAFGPPTCKAAVTHVVHLPNGVQEIAEEFCRDHAVNMVSWYRGSIMEPVKAGAR